MNTKGLNLKESTIFVFPGEDRDWDVDSIHHGFLVSRGVVPSDWVRNEYESLSSYSELSYENNISLFKSKHTLRVTQSGNLKLGEKYESVELLIRYLLAVEKGPFGGLVLRWGLDTPCDSPGDWITDRFVHPEIATGEWGSISSQISLDIDSQGQNMFYTFSSGYLEDEDTEEDQECIDITCGIRQEPLGGSDKVVEWLSNWRALEESMWQTTTLLCGGGLDVSLRCAT